MALHTQGPEPLPTERTGPNGFGKDELPPNKSTNGQEQDLTALADQINALMGVTADDEWRRRRLIIRNAQESASCCGECGKAIKPGEPVWRKRISLGRSIFGGWHTRVVPTCKQCSGEREIRPSKPCEGCGRLVHDVPTYSWTKRRTACCDECRTKAQAKAARERRTKARGQRQCEDCGETFKPTRTDSKFCSVACKQRAYRKRVTDNKPVARDGRNSRNGDAL
jgi:hypothetical protein